MKNNNFLSSIGPLTQKVGNFTQFEIFATSMAPDDPTLIGNLKFKSEMSKSEIKNWLFYMKRIWTALVPLHISLQCSVVSWGYLSRNSLGSFIQRYTRSTSKDSEWINLHRFWVHLLLLFAITFGVMRNDLFVFKIFIPTPYCWQKKEEKTNLDLKWPLAVIRCYSLPLFTICCHLLSLAVRLVVTSCHSIYHSSLVVIRCSLFYLFISDPIGTHLTIKRWHLRVLCKMNALTKSKMFQKNVKSCFSRLRSQSKPLAILSHYLKIL